MISTILPLAEMHCHWHPFIRITRLVLSPTCFSPATSQWPGTDAAIWWLLYEVTTWTWVGCINDDGFHLELSLISMKQSCVRPWYPLTALLAITNHIAPFGEPGAATILDFLLWQDTDLQIRNWFTWEGRLSLYSHSNHRFVGCPNLQLPVTRHWQ